MIIMIIDNLAFGHFWRGGVLTNTFPHFESFASPNHFLFRVFIKREWERRRQKGALGNLSSTRHASQTFLFKQKCNICLAPPDTPQINKRKQCFQDLGICLYLSLGSWEGCIFSFALPEKKSIPGIWALNQVVFCCLFHLFSVFAFVFVFVFSFIFLWRMGWLSGRL